MKHHTFFVGTSKSKTKDAYYIAPLYRSKFWGTLQEAGITDTQIRPEGYRRLGTEYGIYLTEIVDPDEYIVNGDSNIKPHQIKSGMDTLISRIEAHEPNRVGLKNKNAATWFYRYCEDKAITTTQNRSHKRDKNKWDYGLLDWDYYDADYYLLPTMAYEMHYDKEEYMSFWQRCKDDVQRFQSGRSGMNP